MTPANLVQIRAAQSVASGPEPQLVPGVEAFSLPAPGSKLRQGRKVVRLMDLRQPLGRILFENGGISAEDLRRALDLAALSDERLADVIIRNGFATEDAVSNALAVQWGVARADLAATPPDVRLIDAVGIETCLAYGFVPWQRIGSRIVLACARPEDLGRILTLLPADWGTHHVTLVPERAIQAAISDLRGAVLARSAETRVPARESCRSQHVSRGRLVALSAALALVLTLVLAPVALLSAALALTVTTLVALSLFKLAAALAMLRRAPIMETPPIPGQGPAMPVVSVLVPLFRENQIAGRLVKRLSLLDYPRELLDICLVVEADDKTTQDTITASSLPPWIRVVEVPRGGVKTKPRALNYALDFARGSIIGVYDAEDAPEPDQIRKVVRRFQEAGPWVACLQGRLDYYNARTNWLSRSFTIEYAAWFRIVLPGLLRLGFVIPLGGTTLFFRRAALERLGRWDAHNVTEDADLGIRLARHGYTTEMVDTTTLEEANCRLWPWIKQRSRWIKGYAITYGVHMRNPPLLYRQLGLRGFIGVQILFVGTLTQTILAPVLWSFWIVTLDPALHPLYRLLDPGLFIGLGALFVASEGLNLIVNVAGLRAREAARGGLGGRSAWTLLPYVPLMHFYYPFATLAALKGVAEVFVKPFYWDKTQHGITDDTEEAQGVLSTKSTWGTGTDLARPVTPAANPA